VLGNIYTYETALPANVHRGEIIAFTNDGFLIENEFGTTSTVTVASGTGIAFPSNLNVGDIVLVFGPRQGDGMIVAFGIQRTAMATSTGVLVPAE
jgi:hypothetical protein